MFADAQKKALVFAKLQTTYAAMIKFAKLQTVPMALKSWLGDRSVRQGAAVLGVVDNTLHNWLRGSSFPPNTRIPSLAAALGIPTADLSTMVARERSRRVVGEVRRRRGSCRKTAKAAKS